MANIKFTGVHKSFGANKIIKISKMSIMSKVSFLFLLRWGGPDAADG